MRAWGHAGNDRIELIDVALLSMLHGGTGDDELIGGAGDDLLFGGLGNDIVGGASGNDLLIGGLGADRLIGARGHDVLVADTVDPLLGDSELRAIAADWAGGRVTDDGIANTEDETGTLESALDSLTGGSGSDWFIVDLLDKITDIKKNNKDGDQVTIV